MTRTPKTHSSTSSGTTTYGVRSRSSSRLATTNPTAPPGVLEVAGVAELGLRAAVGDVDDAEDAEGEGDPADDLAAGRAVALGVAHVAPADEHEHERHQPADLADRARRRPCGRPPSRCRGAATRRRPRRRRPARRRTARRRRDGARGRGRGRRGRSSGRASPSAVGDPEPDRRDAAAERGEGPEDRARPAADGARRRPAGARGRALARGRASSWSVVLRVRVPDCASGGPSRRTGPTGLGRAPAPRTRRGRRTGRHDTKRRPPSLQSHGPHGRVGARPHAVRPKGGSAGNFPVRRWTRRRG